jgi:asparagine synthase (glutamine-hydrolysing)
MSGICGVFSSAPDATGDAILSAMLQTIKHRGPDGTNVYANAAAGVALGQTHLNAFVADPRTAVPGFAKTDNLVIAIDGCVTNRAEMLNRHTVSLSPDAINQDVMAVMKAYQAYGEECLTHLDGPFSLALWDEQKRTFLLSRDKLGEKSLYYYADPSGSTTVFASEIKAILAHRDVRTELDLDSLSLYFSFGYIPGPRTLFKHIYKLLPGESLHVEMNAQPQRKKYWHLPPIGDGLQDETHCIRRLKELFMRALERYVNGCQDVAVFLSGGVDSSIIVAGLRELGVPRIHTFTVGFNIDPSNGQIHEDLAYARMVAEKFSTRHREVIIGPDHRPGPRLLRVIKQFDDLIMTPNIYSKYLLAEAVRDAGLNSVLTGSAAAGACGVHRKFLDPAKRVELVKKTEECTTDEERYYRLRSRLFNIEEQKGFLCQPPRMGKPEILGVLHDYIGAIKSDDFFRLFLFSNLMITSTEKTLRVLDRAGMLASVELRSPYLDRALVEFSAELPSSFDGGKSYASLKTHLKKAFEQTLPPAVLERKVIGYPSYYWNQGELADYQERLFFNHDGAPDNGVFSYEAVRQIIEREKHSKKPDGKPGWALTQFGLWYEMYVKRNPEYL